jgi:hypothetical protein
MWGQIKGVIGDAAGSFVEMLGDTPEERQKNLEMFTKSIGTINQLGAEMGQTTLAQRLGRKRGAEMVQQAQAPPMPIQPLPPITPEMMHSLMDTVGMGVSGIKEATRWRK